MLHALTLSAMLLLLGACMTASHMDSNPASIGDGSACVEPSLDSAIECVEGEVPMSCGDGTFRCEREGCFAASDPIPCWGCQVKRTGFCKDPNLYMCLSIGCVSETVNQCVQGVDDTADCPTGCIRCADL